jgi:hypothetical protein
MNILLDTMLAVAMFCLLIFFTGAILDQLFSEDKSWYFYFSVAGGWIGFIASIIYFVSGRG